MLDSTDVKVKLPKKSPIDVLYHVEVKLGLVDQDGFKQKFSLVVPLLDTGGQHKKAYGVCC
jgi:hypothetical protein